MIWKDCNGNEHEINDHIELKFQYPDCKYLLPCGICTLFGKYTTCNMLAVIKKEE